MFVQRGEDLEEESSLVDALVRGNVDNSNAALGSHGCWSFGYFSVSFLGLEIRENPGPITSRVPDVSYPNRNIGAYNLVHRERMNDFRPIECELGRFRRGYRRKQLSGRDFVWIGRKDTIDLFPSIISLNISYAHDFTLTHICNSSALRPTAVSAAQKSV